MSESRSTRTRRSDERGGILALMAVVLVVLLAMASLAVDLAMGFAARAEAQRIADAAALAGGSAFLDYLAADAEPVAEARAYEYALMQTIQANPVDSSEVTVRVLTDSMKVRVWITRPGLETWFARVLGINSLDVGAMAAAQASPAGGAKCVKPFAVPDIWDEPAEVGDDLNNDEIWGDGEEWVWGDDDRDGNGIGDEKYQKWDPKAPDNTQATGYGSDHRDRYDPDGIEGDLGRQIQIKVSDPQSDFQLMPSIFYPFRMPEDPDRLNCAQTKPVTGESGASVYQANICECNSQEVLADSETEYLIEPGNMIGPTHKGIGELISRDPDAKWDSNTQTVVGCDLCGNPSNPDAWKGSPRVIKVALFDPSQVEKSGMQALKFNNIAMVFLEEQQSQKDPVTARFLYFADGSGPGGPTSGTLVLYLRLVE